MNQHFLSNGFLVTGQPSTINNKQYHGIDNDVWPEIFEHEDESVLPWIQNGNTGLTDQPFLMDLQTLQKYLQMAKLQPMRTIYCEVASPVSSYFSSILHEKYAKVDKFLGYDYAWANGDYYSAILNDLICRTVPSLEEHVHHLNQFGLFQTEEQIIAFAKDRERLKHTLSTEDALILLEGGSFCTFQIFEI